MALRIRQFLTDLRQAQGGRRVWIFTHQAVIMSFRFVLERLDERRLLDIDRSEALPNCSFTRYTRDAGGPLQLETFGATSHLASLDAPTTREEPRHSPGDSPRESPSDG